MSGRPIEHCRVEPLACEEDWSPIKRTMHTLPSTEHLTVARLTMPFRFDIVSALQDADGASTRP